MGKIGCSSEPMTFVARDAWASFPSLPFLS